MVTLARLSRGMKQAELAARVGVSQGTLSKLESGIGSISDDDLQALSAALGYPPRFFSMRSRVDGGSVAELYHNRKRKLTTAVALNKAYACATIRRIHIERLLNAAEPIDAQFPYYPTADYDEPARTARTVRAALELPNGPVFDIVAVIENAGGIIIACAFDSRQIDGFSRWRHNELPPLFFVNGDAPPDRLRWTLAHELGHVVMHTNADPYDRMEEEANLFAAEFLTPAQLIKPQLLNLTFPRLAGLKTQWKVSIQALIMRAYQLNVISNRQRTYFFTQLSRAGYRLREPVELDPPRENPRALYRLVRDHLDRLGYSVPELAEALALTEREFRALYLPNEHGLEVVK